MSQSEVDTQDDMLYLLQVIASNDYDEIRNLLDANHMDFVWRENKIEPYTQKSVDWMATIAQLANKVLTEPDTPASQHAVGDGEAKRYVVAPDPERPNKFLILDTKPQTIHWGMSQKNAEKEAALYEADYAESLARKQANAAARALNAGSTGNGE